MHRPSLAAASLGALLILSTGGGSAEASGAWVASGKLKPVEQRVAVAAGPARTTLWTSLRFDSDAGAVGVIVPVPPGSALDLSSDAWFEALEVATAPRVFPPAAVADPYCPGVKGPAHVFEIAGDVAHAPSLPVTDVAVLDDAAGVSSWAKQAGLVIGPELSTSLAALSGMRFVAVRFEAPGGPALTPTLRVVMPGAPPVLPLALTHAGADDLRVTTWLLGAGRGHVLGSDAVFVPPGSLGWNAADRDSNYRLLRGNRLATAGLAGALLESTGHGALVENLSIAAGTASIDGVLSAFFDRAAAYGDALADPSTCVAQAAAAIASDGVVGASCPRAGLGFAGDPGPCTELPSPGGIDPATLRCGGIADDLAVALSGLAPTGVWLTRETMAIPADGVGVDWQLAFGGGAEQSPVLYAATVDVATCGGGTSSSGGASSSSGSGWGSSGWVPGSSGGSGNAGAPSGGSSDDGGGRSVSGSGSHGSVGVRVGVNGGCSSSTTGDGSTSDSSGCDGSTASTDETNAGSCSGDSGSGSSDACSGGSSGSSDACSGGSSGAGDACSGGSGADFNCSGGGSVGSCSMSSSGGKARGAPRLSPFTLGLLALVAPLRRRGRRARRPQPVSTRTTA